MSERKGRKRKREIKKGVWETARYRPFPGPLSIATPSKLRLRHAICATVGSWNFASPKITPARGPSKEGRGITLPFHRRGRISRRATRWLAGWRASRHPSTLPPRLFVYKRADHRRHPSVNRAHTWPIVVRYIHLYVMYPRLRSSFTAKRGIHRYRANRCGKLIQSSIFL